MQNTPNEHTRDGDTKQNGDHSRSTSVSTGINNSTAQQIPPHPLQLEHQLKPWLIPHPNLPISWQNNDHPHNLQEGVHDQEPPTGADIPSSSQSTSLLRLRGNDRGGGVQRPAPNDAAMNKPKLQGYDWRQHQYQQYLDNISDQGHESDPSELLRAPILMSSSPPRNLLQSQEFNQQGREDMSSVRRSQRSMSLSVATNNVWRDNGSPRALPSPSSRRDHHEVVPYSQEWRVILRSPPRGRTVLYNPQMQSLVVQSTVGLDSHPMTYQDEAGICALCRRPLDLDEAVNERFEDDSESFMDTNYFRMLADANIALSRRGSLQAEPEMSFQGRPSIGVPTSSSRTSLDLDNQPQDHSASPHLSHNALNQGYYERFFVEQKKLGRGFRGSVFLCQHVLDGIHLGEYAIKKVAVGDNHDWLVQMLREVHLLERLHHPNIVSYKHAWLENHQLHKFGPEVTCLFILMECANGGNLEEYIERPPAETNSMDIDQTLAGTSEGAPSNTDGETPKTLTAKELALQAKRQRLKLNASSGKSGEGSGANRAGEKDTTPQRRHLSVTEIWSFFFDICEGLAHLHRLGIIHRDLKPPNLLLSYSNSRIKGTKGERPRILITDFGECEILDQTDKRDRTGATGTLEFLAPELLSVDADGKYTDEFSFKGDMWSLGMVLYYLCYSRLPYSQIEDVDLLRDEIRQFEKVTIPEDDGPGGRAIPKDLKILIRVLLSTDKNKRPSCEEILLTLSHQRDRMMHGDMDSPSAPIRGSASNIKEEEDGAQQADDHISDDGATKISEEVPTDSTKTSSSSPSQLATKTAAATAKKSNVNSPSYHSVAISRRTSRPTLITEKAKGVASGSSNTHHHTTAPLAPAPYPLGARKTATPSVNLHKKVKPLGIGLRYMLRRRTMHNPAAVSGSGMGLQRYPRTGYGSVNTGYSSTAMPMALGRPKVTSATPLSSAMTMEQNSTSLFKPSPVRVGTLPQVLQSPLSSSPSLQPPSTQQHQSQMKEPDAKEDAPSPSPLSSGEKSPAPGRADSSHDSEGSELDPEQFHRVPMDASAHSDSHPVKDAEAGEDDGGFRKMIATQQPVLGKHHWTDLAEAHAFERSLSSSPATTATAASLIATKRSEAAIHPTAMDHLVVDSSEDSPFTSATDGIAAELKQRRRQQQQQGLPIRKRRDSRAASGHHRQFTRSRFEQPVPAPQGQGHGREPSISEQQLQHAHQLQPHVQHPPRVQNNYLLPELSACYMFLSLVLRIWFCLSLCNPVMVRPIVLYPVLVLTVIGDRYVLHLVADTFFRVKTASHRGGGRRGSMTERQDQRRQRRSMDSARRGSLSHDRHPFRESMDGTRLALAGSSIGTTGATTARATATIMNRQRGQGLDVGSKNATGDEDSQDDGVANQEQGYEGSSSLAAVKERLGGPHEHSGGQNGEGYELQVRKPSVDGGDDDDGDRHGPLETIWWAFASGFVLQLLWISGVKMFDRGGLCVAP